MRYTAFIVWGGSSEDLRRIHVALEAEQIDAFKKEFQEIAVYPE